MQEKIFIKLAEDSIAQAEKEDSKLSSDILSIPGMSSSKVRHLLNNLCSKSCVKYLEIGCWQGSTLISALYNNDRKAVGIDDWSEFGNQRETFYAHVERFIPTANLSIHETNCFSIDKEKILEKINVYFYDGHHSEESQEAAFTYFDDVLDDLFIAIVDDWNWERVRNGTFSAFKKLNYSILFEKELFSRWNGDRESWWNGLYVGVIKKRRGT